MVGGIHVANRLSRAVTWLRALAPAARTHDSPNDRPSAPSTADDRAATDSPVGADLAGSGVQPVDSRALKAAAQTIHHELELALRVDPRRVSQAAALNDVLTLVFGAQRSAAARLRFFSFAAPIARRIALARADNGQRVIDRDITVANVREMLAWYDSFDPWTACMLDLHYVAGISIKQIACALRIQPAAIVGSLHQAKDCLRVKLDRLE